MEREIRAEFRNLHRFLDEEEENDLERLRKEKEKRINLLKERERKIAMQGRNLEKVVESLNYKLTEEDSPRLLRDIRELLKRCDVNYISPPPVDSEVYSGQFVGPIQYRIWKHMKACLYPNISVLTFDPETAHPLLDLSSSCSSVVFDEDKPMPSKEELERNPRCFNYYYCIFGREGFTTGRHYWEVGVATKTAWRVGVAREDIPRGEMKSSTCAEGFWTLALKNGSVVASTYPKPTALRISFPPVRIGVFLDCEREEVTFYNAVTMAPLFSFIMDDVEWPLLPFYNPCDTDEGRNVAPITMFSPSL
ncbi:zinc-binding protein A33 isoform X2 [Engraulis encrasicolus]